MNKHQSYQFIIVISTLAVFLFGVSLLNGCTPSEQGKLETEIAKIAKTAVEKQSNYAATQLFNLKETAAALAATEANQIKQTLEAALPFQETPDPNTVNPEVQAARDILKVMDAMKTPWNQVTTPIQNDINRRNSINYANVIDQFDVDSEDLAGRYKSGGSGVTDTRCNIFTGDVMRAMGVPLPTKGNLGKGQGNPNATYTDPMTAQASLLNDYLNKKLKWVTSSTDPGILSDWDEIKPTTTEELFRLIEHVNTGKPAVVSDSGHIAVIRPGQSIVQTWKDLIIAQAGATNFLYGPLKGHFFGTPQFFIHE